MHIPKKNVENGPFYNINRIKVLTVQKKALYGSSIRKTTTATLFCDLLGVSVEFGYIEYCIAKCRYYLYKP
jgi:hypothetical protein